MVLVQSLLAEQQRDKRRYMSFLEYMPTLELALATTPSFCGALVGDER